MQRFLIPGVLVALVAFTVGISFVSQPNRPERVASKVVINELELQKKKPKNLKEKAIFNRGRVQYEYDMMKDPVTGRLPVNYRNIELAKARLLPERIRDSRDVLMQTTSTTNTTANNTYVPAGPVNVGGRTRAVAYDKLYMEIGRASCRERV